MGHIKHKHIFVVDDDEMFSAMIKDHLEQNPQNKVKVFHTGEECLKNLFENPDIVILDYYLNDVSKEAADGLEVLTEIKKQHEFIHVIMLSSQERYGVALQSISKGAEQYVIKDKNAFKKLDEIMIDLS